MAKLGRRIATEYLDPTILESFLANRLIPLDKNPGTRPVGVGEVSRRVIGKAIMHVVKKDVMEAGVLNLCAGQEAGIQAAIHAMIRLFDDESTDAILLIDADNCPPQYPFYLRNLASL